MSGNDLIYDETNVLLQKENAELIDENIKFYEALKAISNVSSDTPIGDVARFAKEVLREYEKTKTTNTSS